MKILFVTSDLDGGGIERLLFNYCTRLRDDAQFDFAIMAPKEGILEKPLKEIGCKIFRIPTIHKSLTEHNRQLMEIMVKGNYDIVHDHGGYCGLFTMMIAKKCGIKIRIEHSHSSYEPENSVQKIKRKFLTRLTTYYATDLFACGIDAGKWMWGSDRNVYIMKNAIDTKTFMFNKLVREQIRKELDLGNKFVIGNVARFSFEKNHRFLINVFSQICKIRSDAILLLVGSGELEPEIKHLANELKIVDKVMFLGTRNDVFRLLNAMDVFVLPSLHEGLPVTLVEVQANGLEAFVSDSVTKEVSISPNCHYLPIDETYSTWSEQISTASSERCTDFNNISKYDISNASNELLQHYKMLIKKRK